MSYIKLLLIEKPDTTKAIFRGPQKELYHFDISKCEHYTTKFSLNTIHYYDEVANKLYSYDPSKYEEDTFYLRMLPRKPKASAMRYSDIEKSYSGRKGELDTGTTLHDILDAINEAGIDMNIDQLHVKLRGVK